MRLPNLIRKEVSAGELLRQYSSPEAHILNLGSGNIRFGPNSVGLDIQRKTEVDIIGDAHTMPLASGLFDVIICVGAMQYFRNPFKVASEMARVLKPNGLIIVDAPFVQHYCPDTPDLFRYSKSGLEAIYEDLFDILELRTSIAGGSALAFYLKGLAGYSSPSRVVRAAIGAGISLIAFPLKFFTFSKRSEVAGALILVGRKKSSK